MRFFAKGNWGLRLLALTLAIIIYEVIKTENSRTVSRNDRTFFQH